MQIFSSIHHIYEMNFDEIFPLFLEYSILRALLASVRTREQSVGMRAMPLETCVTKCMIIIRQILVISGCQEHPMY